MKRFWNIITIFLNKTKNPDRHSFLCNIRMDLYLIITSSNEIIKSGIAPMQCGYNY